MGDGDDGFVKPNVEVCNKMKTIYRDILGIERGIIVHGCNGYGVMGAGLAAQVKRRYPSVITVIYSNKFLT